MLKALAVFGQDFIFTFVIIKQKNHFVKRFFKICGII